MRLGENDQKTFRQTADFGIVRDEFLYSEAVDI